ISVERELATELGVRVGDEIVWDVQGRLVPSRVAHLREVTWARFEPNFFVVFPPGPLDGAPQSFVTLSRADDPRLRASVQRSVVEHFPNVTTIDLAQVQQALDRIVSRVALAIRFMALFSLATGAVVLVGAVATSRYQRLREAVLLKTLGATRGQILRIALAESVALGLLASAAALLLATGADCESCADKVRGELKKVKGVKKVDFDRQKVEITVRLDETVADADVLAAVERAGLKAVAGAGHGAYLPAERYPAGADVQVLSR